MAAIDVYVYENFDSVDSSGAVQGLREHYDYLVANSVIPDYEVTVRDVHPNIDEGEVIYDLLAPFESWLWNEFGVQSRGSHCLVAEGGGGIAQGSGAAWSEPMACISSESGVTAAQEVGHNFIAGWHDSVVDLGYADDAEHSLGRIYADGDVSPMAAGYVSAGHAHAGNCDALADHTGYALQPTECTVQAYEISWEAYGGTPCEDAEPTPIDPYLRVGDGETWGEWQNASSVEIEPGQVVQFGPQPVEADGWSWSGPGVDAASRQISVSPEASSTYTVSYTDPCGLTSTLEFTVSVADPCEGAEPTPIDPYLRVGDGDSWGEWQNASSVEIEPGQVVELAPQPEAADGWSWSGPDVDAASRVIAVSPEETSTYTATYTDSCDRTSVQEFAVTVQASVCGGVAGAESTSVDGQTVCDLAGDGLHRDVTGDGSLGQDDVVHFFENQHRDAWKDPGLFDFSESGSVGHGDVVALFEDVVTGA